MSEREKLYRNALMWAFDRLGVAGGMTEKEQLRTMREIGNVLCGRRSPASAYEPNDWDSSAKLPVKGVQDLERCAACGVTPFLYPCLERACPFYARGGQ